MCDRVGLPEALLGLRGRQPGVARELLRLEEFAERSFPGNGIDLVRSRVICPTYRYRDLDGATAKLVANSRFHLIFKTRKSVAEARSDLEKTVVDRSNFYVDCRFAKPASCLALACHAHQHNGSLFVRT